ncbi:hypothetical protein EDD86DRAFT_250457 [Gorgonomyces haynaldii]|nr:hypothetical protein EDD86DRAFT_250457 [Gorgonomyces haynaldii]
MFKRTFSVGPLPDSKFLDSFRKIEIRAPQKQEIQPHILHCHCSRNNTMLTLTDHVGKTLGWSSAGSCGLKGAKRGTSDAGYQAAIQLAQKFSPPFVHLKFHGFGKGREQVFRALKQKGWNFVRFTDLTAIRFGGNRPPKRRRI